MYKRTHQELYRIQMYKLISWKSIFLVLVVKSYTDKFKGCYKKSRQNLDFGFQGYT